MSKQPSLVFDVMEAFADLLDGQSWPVDSSGSEVVVLDGPTNDPPIEVVALIGVPPAPPSIDTATNLSNEETFTLRTLIDTALPGRSRREAMARVKELAAVLQLALRDSTGRLTNTFNGQGATYAVPGVISWRVAAVRPHSYPMAEGWGAFCELDTVFKTRI